MDSACSTLAPYSKRCLAELHHSFVHQNWISQTLYHMLGRKYFIANPVCQLSFILKFFARSTSCGWLVIAFHTDFIACSISILISTQDSYWWFILLSSITCTLDERPIRRWKLRVENIWRVVLKLDCLHFGEKREQTIFGAAQSENWRNVRSFGVKKNCTNDF